MLAAAGLLDGLTASTHWGTADEIEGYGATYPQPPFDSGSIAKASPEVLERARTLG